MWLQKPNTNFFNVSSIVSTSGDSFKYNNNMKFSSKDQDNDIWPKHCSIDENGNGGGWFGKCSHNNLNGLYSRDGTGYKYMTWHHAENNWKSMKSSRMMIRKY